MKYTNDQSGFPGKQTPGSDPRNRAVEPLPTELANNTDVQSAEFDPPTSPNRPVSPRDYSKSEFGDEATTQVVHALLNRIRELENAPSLTPAPDLLATGYVDIVQFLRVLVSHLVLIVVVGVLGTLLTFFVVNSQTPIFQVETSLAVTPNINESAIPRPIQQIEVALGTYVQVLRSQNLKNQVETKLSETYNAAQLANVEIEVRPVENSSIIVITVQSADAVLAQAYALAVVDTVLTDNPLPLFEISYRMDVLDAPNLPTEPIFPDKKVGLVLGGIGSVILGIVLAFFVETYMTQRRRARAAMPASA